MVRKLLSLFILFFALVAYSSAQTGTVTGKITDGNGEALIGANVVVKGTTIGTVSDIDGNYTITGVPTGQQTLVSSFIGYAIFEQTLEVKAGETVKLDITLVEDIATLEELVVVGYGTQKTKEITGSITSVKAEDFNNGNINNAAQLIQGKVAGLSITRPGSDPNADFTIRLRGLSTFGGNTQPLIIVDGIQGVDLKSVDPEDIASMDVLKDASASAIYGTKGASGVIIITTKKGKKGTEDKPVNVEFSSSFTTTSIDKEPDVLTMDEYLKFPNSVDFRTDTINGTGTDWIDEITQTAFTQTYGLAASGATNNASYRMSFNYRDGEGVIKGTGFDQLSGRLNLTQKALQDMLTLDFNFSGSVRNEQYSPGGAVIQALTYNPTAPIFENTPEAEQYGGYFQRNAYNFYNPVAILEQNTNDGKKTAMAGSLKATLEPIKGLKLSAFYSQDIKNNLYGEYNSILNYYSDFQKGYARRAEEYYVNKMFEGIVNYDKTFGELDANIMGGYSFQDAIAEGFWAQSNEFISDFWGYNNLGDGESSLYPADQHKDSWKNESVLIGYFGIASFNYDDTYFLRGQLRTDGSSMFGDNNKWGTFYGLSGGVDIAKFINVEKIDRLKVRGGIGTTGNLPGGPYHTIDTYGKTGYFYLNGAYIPSYGKIQQENPNLQWEVKKEVNIGLDYGFFDYKVTGSLEYYTNTPEQLILAFNIPKETDLQGTTMNLNLGQLKNSGVEFTVSWNVLEKGDFSWTTDFNFTKYLNAELVTIQNDIYKYNGGQLLVAELGAPNYIGTNMIALGEGDPIGQIVGKQVLSLDSLGIFHYKQDSLGEDLIEVIGNGLPKFQVGWGNTLKYKNFDLNFFFRGVFGHDLVNSNNAKYGNATGIGIQSGMAIALDYMNANDPADFSDIHVENASFVKLDNFALGYTLNLDENKYVSKVRAYISGQNLFTITNYTGTSPEVRYSDGGYPLAPGIDRGDTYFGTRSFTFGLNVTF